MVEHPLKKKIRRLKQCKIVQQNCCRTEMNEASIGSAASSAAVKVTPTNVINRKLYQFFVFFKVFLMTRQMRNYAKLYNGTK